MFAGSVGFTAIDVSLCGPLVSQSVFTLAALVVAVVQIAVPVLTWGPVPNTAPAIGAWVSRMLWVKSTGCGSPPSSPAARAGPAPATSTRDADAASRAEIRRAGLRARWFTACPFGRCQGSPGIQRLTPFSRTAERTCQAHLSRG